MKKLFSISLIFALCLSIFCSCGEETEPNNPLVENPEDRLSVTEQTYRDLSFLNKEQRALLEDNADTLFCLAFAPAQMFSDIIGENPQYYQTSDMLYAITDIKWQKFHDRMLNIITEDYFVLLQKNQHFADNDGTFCVAEYDKHMVFGDFAACTDNIIVTEYSDERIVFECHRYRFDAALTDGHTADELYEMAVFNTRFSHKDVYTFCLVNTAEGWRVDDFYQQALYRASVYNPQDHLGERYPVRSLADPSETPVEIAPVYNQQIEAEQLTRCLAESIKSIDPTANTVVFNHHSLILQLATVNDKYFAYNNFAPVAANGERMFSAPECEKLLNTVLGVNINCADLFNEHNYVVRDDMYVNPTFVERLTDYSCENLQFSVAGSGLDCSVTFDLMQHNTTFDNETYKGTFVFRYKLVPAENHWQFAGFEML